MNIFLKNGIRVKTDGLEVALDPGNANTLSFISHAHSDHLPRKVSAPVIASKETLHLMKNKGLKIQQAKDSRLEMLDAGHMFGSKMLKIKADKTVLYTGDFSTRDRYFIKGAEPSKTDILIVENTFADQEYVFPPLFGIEQRVGEWLEGVPSAALFGYTLGKAQVLTAMVNELGYTPIVHSNIYIANKLAESHGHKVGSYHLFGSPEAEAEETKIYIAPPQLLRSELTYKLKKQGTKTAMFSGWAQNGTRRWYSADECFPLSDHSDASELEAFIKGCKPESILTVHGYDEKFEKRLRRQGFDISRLTKDKKLNQFF